jgi:hypothetical protein
MTLGCGSWNVSCVGVSGPVNSLFCMRGRQILGQQTSTCITIKPSADLIQQRLGRWTLQRITGFGPYSKSRSLSRSIRIKRRPCCIRPVRDQLSNTIYIASRSVSRSFRGRNLWWQIRRHNRVIRKLYLSVSSKSANNHPS